LKIQGERAPRTAGEGPHSRIDRRAHETWVSAHSVAASTVGSGSTGTVLLVVAADAGGRDPWPVGDTSGGMVAPSGMTTLPSTHAANEVMSTS
jgi:hypothetical protein